MDAIVQLIRNALCCVKDLNLWSDSFLYDASYTSAYMTTVSPIDETTPLEWMIGICQFYAFVSLSRTGIVMMMQNYPWKHYQDLQDALQQSHRSDDNDGDDHSLLANGILLESLQLHLRNSKKSFWIGLNVAIIGISFFWLFANSLHITQTSWIGGVQGLIHALTAMELALVVLLYYMIVDSTSLLTKSTRLQYVATIVEKTLVGKKRRLPAAIFNHETLEWIVHPNDNDQLIQWDSKENAKAVLDTQQGNVQKTLKKWIHDDNTVLPLQETSIRLKHDAAHAYFKGICECIYFFLNFIAFYGYLLGILVYYMPEDETSYVQLLKLGMSHDSADWHGNFAGDFMWTVEPMLILSNTILFAYTLQPTSPKTTKEEKKKME